MKGVPRRQPGAARPAWLTEGGFNYHWLCWPEGNDLYRPVRCWRNSVAWLKICFWHRVMLSVVFQHCIMAEDIGLRVFKDEYISRNDHIMHKKVLGLYWKSSQQQQDLLLWVRPGSSDLVRICRMSPGDQWRTVEYWLQILRLHLTFGGMGLLPLHRGGMGFCPRVRI